MVASFFRAPICVRRHSCANGTLMHQPACARPLVGEAAAALVQILSEFEQHLPPIPLTAIEDMLARTGRTTIH